MSVCELGKGPLGLAIWLLSNHPKLSPLAFQSKVLLVISFYVAFHKIKSHLACLWGEGREKEWSLGPCGEGGEWNTYRGLNSAEPRARFTMLHSLSQPGGGKCAHQAPEPEKP